MTVALAGLPSVASGTEIRGSTGEASAPSVPSRTESSVNVRPGVGSRVGDWMGPEEGDLLPDGSTLRHRVSPERWPHGPPDYHEACCLLFTGGLFCDCAASAADGLDHGVGA